MNVRFFRPAPDGERAKKILIVDDRESVAQSLSSFFRIKGMEVMTASGYQEAKSWVMSTDFDVVLADVRLEGPSNRSGLDLLSFIRWRRPLAKIVIITGFGSEEVEKEAYRRGAFLYLEKPVDLNVLSRHLADIGVLPA